MTAVDGDDVATRLAEVDDDDPVIRAGRALLAEVGLEQVELDEVAARAGVGRSTIYRRFESRNGLLTAVVAAECRAFFAGLVAGVDPAADSVQQVTDAFRAGLAWAEESGFGETARTSATLLRLLTVDAGPLIAAARSVLAEAALARDPRLRPARAEALADALVRLAISHVLTPATDPPEIGALFAHR